MPEQSLRSCPKCGFTYSKEQDYCLRCGVIFSKINTQPQSSKAKPCSDSPSPKSPSNYREIIQHLVLHVPDEVKSQYVYGRAFILAGLAVWGTTLIFSSISSNTAGESFMHLVNLPFHEFGHMLFRPFGSFIASLGGTLGQLLFPLICMVVLLLQTRDPFGAGVCLWWFGENFLDIAPYINDARAGILPLVGGNTGHTSPYGFHDWEYLLTETGLLHYDTTLAKLSHGLGALLMTLAIIWAGYIVFQQYRNRA